jgi:hypothetical protein
LPPIDLVAFAGEELSGVMSAQGIADRLLEHAIGGDLGRPGDDLGVVAMRIADHDDGSIIRRMQAQFPMP